tara:strand:- start:1010 stop:1177 length:168 start_codon:yes stop_codon:yes gene_type:complete
MLFVFRMTGLEAMILSFSFVGLMSISMGALATLATPPHNSEMNHPEEAAPQEALE